MRNGSCTARERAGYPQRCGCSLPHSGLCSCSRPASCRQVLSPTPPPATPTPIQLQYAPSAVSTKDLTASFGWNTYDAFMQHDVQVRRLGAV